MPLPDAIFKQIKQLIPPLNGKLHKGQAGRVGVLGGALDYTGAPFFAAFSAMRIGVDLSHVICAPTAASAIKGYAPDLIVHPILRNDASQESVESELKSLFTRLHVLVLGPGLGREQYMLSYARIAIRLARERGMFLVLDADALFLLSQAPEIVRGYPRSVLTPNVVEFKRLCESVNIDPNADPSQRALLASRALGGVTILQKGASDIIAVHPCSSTSSSAASPCEPQLETSPNSGRSVEVSDATTLAQNVHAAADAPHKVEVDVPGSLKRCGGQGDILSGTVGAFLAWARCLEDGAWTLSPNVSPSQDPASVPADPLQSMDAAGKPGHASSSSSVPRVPSARIPLVASAGAALITRTAAHRAFLKQGRALITQDILGELGGAFAEVFGADAEWGVYASKAEGSSREKG